MSYSTQRVSTKLLDEIKTALNNIHYGSVEIYIQDKKVTQITVRNIKKTTIDIDQDGRQSDQSRQTTKQTLSRKIEVLTINK